MSPRISVIVPIYKVEAYLRKCLDSLVRQEYQNLEIILVDDGSPDSCGQICEEYAETDSRITVIHQENGGIGSARNAGLRICTGQFIMFVDPDDYLAENAIRLLYDRLVMDGSDMAIGKFVLEYEDGRMEKPRQKLWEEYSVCTKEDVLCRDGGSEYLFVAAWCKLYKRELLEGIEFPVLKVAEDLWVFPLVLDRCQRISLVDSWIYFYVQRSGSAIKSVSNAFRYGMTKAHLHMARYVYDAGYDARKWYATALANAVHIQKRKDRVDLIRQFFDKRERRLLLRGTTLKIKLRWICVHTPFSF